MKTKNLLVIILLIGLSFNAFSQEEVTIKQVIKNSSTSSKKLSGDGIYVIKTNTSLPITIKEGVENAIYLTGEFNSPEDYKGFCTLEDGALKIDSPKKGKSITLELASDVQLFQFNNNSNVVIKKDIIIRNQGVIFINNNSKLNVTGYITGNELKVDVTNNSKIDFFAVYLNQLDLKIEKESEAKLNGNVNKLNLTKDNDSKFVKDKFSISKLMESIVSYEGDTIKEENKIISLKEISKIISENEVSKSEGKDAEDSKNLKKEESNEVTKTIADAFKAAADNLKNKDGKVEQKEKKKESKTDFGLQVGYGILSWSNRVSSVDDLFSSPGQEYSLNCGSSWNLGFRYEFKLNRRWTISTGLGYESDIFRFKNNVMLTENSQGNHIALETNTSIDPECKLVARYVTLPLFVKFRVAKSFAFHVGAIGGLNFRTSSTGFKRDYDIPHGEVEERWGANYANFKPVKLDVQAGFGWGDLNFYARYSLTPLFKTNTETEVYPYSVGVSFGL